MLRFFSSRYRINIFFITQKIHKGYELLFVNSMKQIVFRPLIIIDFILGKYFKRYIYIYGVKSEIEFF